MTVNESPPRWADVLLRASLASRDVESVSGDLLEEYRQNVLPVRGRWRADVWYVTQSVSFAWRAVGAFAALFALTFLARTAVDWRIPTADFHTRSLIVTFVSAGIFLLAGIWAGARSGSSSAGALAGAVTAAFALPMQLIGAAALLAVWHDPTTLAAIRGSGGLAEVFTLPIMTFLPAVVIGTIGGLVGTQMCPTPR